MSLLILISSGLPQVKQNFGLSGHLSMGATVSQGIVQFAKVSMLSLLTFVVIFLCSKIKKVEDYLSTSLFHCYIDFHAKPCTRHDSGKYSSAI